MGKTWGDWRDEQEDVARDNAVVRQHGRDLRARLRDAMARGDRVWLQCAGVRFTGFVVEVDTDLLSLRDSTGERIDVRLDAVPHMLFGLLAPAAGSGCTPPLTSGGFRGRALMAETGGARYAVHVGGDEPPLVGAIAVGLDHLDVVGDDGSVTVSLAMVVALRRVSPGASAA